MSLNTYDSSSGTLTNIASSSRVWTGTKAEWQALVNAGTAPRNVLVAITDDDQEPSATVTEGDENAVQGGAVYDAIRWKTTTLTFTLNGGGSNPFNVSAVYKPHDMMILFFNAASYNLGGNWYRASFDSETIGKAANTCYCGELLNSSSSYRVSKRLYTQVGSPTITMYDIDSGTSCDGMVIVPLV